MWTEGGYRRQGDHLPLAPLQWVAFDCGIVEPSQRSRPALTTSELTLNHNGSPGVAHMSHGCLASLHWGAHAKVE